MVRHNIGLRGYIGEEITKLWLGQKYGKENIVRQVIPGDFPKRGGPYLDFGVLQKGDISRVYEVKTQDWKLKEDGINKPLKYIWKNLGKIEYFSSQGRQRYQADKNVEGFLVLLRAPKGELAEKLEGKFVLFEQVFREISPKDASRIISDVARRDAFDEFHELARLSGKI